LKKMFYSTSSVIGSSFEGNVLKIKIQKLFEKEVQ